MPRGACRSANQEEGYRRERLRENVYSWIHKVHNIYVELTQSGGAFRRARHRMAEDTVLLNRLRDQIRSTTAAE
jgi:hypothetical protein